MKKTAILISIFFPLGFTFAQTITNDTKIEVIQCSEFHITKPLSELFDQNQIDEEFDFKDKKESPDRENRKPQNFLYKSADGAQYGNDPSSMQRVMGTKQPEGTLQNWAGQAGGGYPPDPTGAAGPSNYVQAVNSTPFRVYSKTGAVQLTGSIGALFGSNTNDGDPIVMYDKFADRWFLSQFGMSGNNIYIAISQTNNPTGQYYVYTFTSPEFPDYLKFSVWENGYYMTSNQQTEKVFCFERAKMLVGNASARAINRTFVTGATGYFFVPLPADADGQLPPSGARCPFFSYYDNAWGGGYDAVKVWSMGVTWGTTPTADITLDATLTTSAFDASYNQQWDDIPQPSGDFLDGIGGVCTFRAQWRKWTTYNSVVLNWGVKISSTQRSIKWVELRQNQSSGTWTLYQQGTYTPDAHSRWVGSIAMNDQGSIALCYAKSSSTVSPSLCYTGRLATDPLGTMTFAETIAKAGSGSQAGVNRFGDYSQTTIDPSDGLTFWHTGEYILNGGPATRIYSFRLPLVGIDEIQYQPSFNIYQTENVLNIDASKLPSDDELVVDLFDITGKQISEKQIKPTSRMFETTISIAGLAKATYLVRVGNPSFQKVVKVVVN